jgi:hypothetical protein
MMATRFLQGLIALSLVVVGGCSRRPTSEEMAKGMSDENLLAMRTMHNTPFISPGIDNPMMVDSSNANLRDDEVVIGINLNGAYRAYPLSKLSAIVDHVVNDAVRLNDGNTAALTVTYCDRTDCIRVVEPIEPVAGRLQISTLGLLRGGLALSWNGVEFEQSEAVAGLRDRDFERATWKDWKSEHPDTVVYVGRSKSNTDDLQSDEALDSNQSDNTSPSRD